MVLWLTPTRLMKFTLRNSVSEDNRGYGFLIWLMSVNAYLKWEHLKNIPWSPVSYEENKFYTGKKILTSQMENKMHKNICVDIK